MQSFFLFFISSYTYKYIINNPERFHTLLSFPLTILPLLAGPITLPFPSAAGCSLLSSHSLSSCYISSHSCWPPFTFSSLGRAGCSYSLSLHTSFLLVTVSLVTFSPPWRQAAPRRSASLPATSWTGKSPPRRPTRRRGMRAVRSSTPACTSPTAGLGVPAGGPPASGSSWTSACQPR